MEVERRRRAVSQRQSSVRAEEAAEAERLPSYGGEAATTRRLACVTNKRDGDVMARERLALRRWRVDVGKSRVACHDSRMRWMG